MLGGGSDVAGCQKLVEETLSAVTGCSLQSAVERFTLWELQRIGVVCGKVTQVKCVRSGLLNRNGTIIAEKRESVIYY